MKSLKLIYNHHQHMRKLSYNKMREHLKRLLFNLRWRWRKIKNNIRMNNHQKWWMYNSQSLPLNKSKDCTYLIFIEISQRMKKIKTSNHSQIKRKRSSMLGLMMLTRRHMRKNHKWKRSFLRMLWSKRDIRIPCQNINLWKKVWLEDQNLKN